MKKLIIPALLIFVIFMSFGFSGKLEQDKAVQKDTWTAQEQHDQAENTVRGYKNGGYPAGEGSQVQQDDRDGRDHKHG